jgi:hypothetical protein
VADQLLALLQGEPASDRLGRQPSLQELKNELLKLGPPQQSATPPAARIGLLTGIAWLVTRRSTVAF